MRIFLLSISLMTFVGCHCSPATPQPVTLRVVNTTRSPIYLDGTAGRLGLTVKREVNGALFGFDDLACTCRYCVNACSTTCSCPDAGTGHVIKVESGAKIERTWDGVVQVAGFNNCGTEGCLDQQNAPIWPARARRLLYGGEIVVKLRFKAFNGLRHYILLK